MTFQYLHRVYPVNGHAALSNPHSKHPQFHELLKFWQVGWMNALTSGPRKQRAKGLTIFIYPASKPSQSGVLPRVQQDAS